MIKLMEGFRRQEAPALFEQMFRQRANVFHHQLGWNVTVDADGLEYDAFDRDDTVYLMSLDEAGQLTGSVRFLPTVSEHMMSGPFAPMFPGLTVRSPTIWEATRFVADQSRGVRDNGIGDTACELLLGMAEFGLDHGVTQIIALMEAPIIRLYRRCGLNQYILGRHHGEHGTIVLGLWNIDRALLSSIRRATGLDASVFARPALPLDKVA